MAELTRQNIAGNFDNILEYQKTSIILHTLKENALGTIEDLLTTEKTNSHSGMWFTSDHESVVREMELFHVDTTEEDPVLFVNGYAAETHQLLRRPISTEVIVRSEFFREGHRRESATVAIKEFVEGCHVPFISHYAIERYVGDTLQARVSRTDAIKGSGLDEREMVPYDFREFGQQMNILVAMRKGLLLANSNSEDMSPT